MRDTVVYKCEAFLHLSALDMKECLSPLLFFLLSGRKYPLIRDNLSAPACGGDLQSLVRLSLRLSCARDPRLFIRHIIRDAYARKNTSPPRSVFCPLHMNERADLQDSVVQRVPAITYT